MKSIGSKLDELLRRTGGTNGPLTFRVFTKPEEAPPNDGSSVRFTLNIGTLKRRPEPLRGEK